MVPTDVKPGNEARVCWRRGENVRTEVALLFLHGFTASPGECGDLPDSMAAELDANLYIHRWPGHGLRSPDALQGLTLDLLQASALSALSKAAELGDNVVIVGSSLGASLGLWLASVRVAEVAAVVAWSPGVRPAHPVLLDQLCAAHQPVTDPRPRTADVLAYWSQTVHPDGYRALRSLLDSFAHAPPWPRVVCPVYLGFYRAPDGEQDQTASVAAMLDMFDALGTAPALKQAMPFASAAHSIGSPYKSALAAEVARASVAFVASKVMAFASRDHPPYRAPSDRDD
nr:alpha/beta fold hydrolase [Dyella silvatica]